MRESTRSYVPAAGSDWLLPFYDPFTWLMGAESLQRTLLEQADLQVGARVLEIGCGTGNLTLLAKRIQPKAELIGLDPDPKALARARRKAERAGLTIGWIEGFADELPLGDRSLDRVLSSFMLHHLPTEGKRAALREVARVLRPGGSLHVLDFGGTHTHTHGLLARLVHRREEMRENFDGRIPEMMREAGLAEAAELQTRRTLFGSVGYWRAGVRAAGGA